MMWRVKMVLAALCVACVEGQVFFKGNCPETPIIKDFDWDQYLGQWFEQERYFVAYQEILGRCWSGTYIRNQSSGNISVRLDFQDAVLSRPKVITVNVHQKRPSSEPNRLTYTIPGIPVFEDNYEVLATDYHSWTLEYSCLKKSFLGHAKMAWILTREEHPPASVIQEAKEVLTLLGIDTEYLKQQDTSCFTT